MSVKIMGLVWDLDIPTNEKLILLAYADHADHAGNSIYPSIELISNKTNYSIRTVQRITRNLEERGLLIPEGGQKGGRGISAHWSIPLKGDKLTPFVKGDIHDQKGDICDTKRVTSEALKGDIAMSPEPSVNHHIKPSVNQKKKKHLSADELFTLVPIPEKFESDLEFKRVWFEKIEQRIEKRKPFTERAAKMTMNKLAELPVNEAINLLECSIAGDWQGVVFPDKNNRGNGGGDGRMSRHTAAKQRSDEKIARMAQETIQNLQDQQGN